MTLRIGVDLDGTLADLSSAYHEYEERLFGKRTADEASDEAEPPAEPTDKEKLQAAKDASKRREHIWAAIRQTTDFWTLLEPIEPGAVRALHEVSVAHRWEVFFVTQRPRTAGDSVQAQTQRWLIQEGFATPSVLTLSGSRGKAAYALELDFLIDDTAKNCVDVIADSKCRPLLVTRHSDAAAEASARRLNIITVPSVAEALKILSSPPKPPRASGHPLTKLLGFLGLPTR